MTKNGHTWNPINETLYTNTKSLLKSAIPFVLPLVNRENIEDFMEKTRIDYPYIGRFVSKNLPDYFNKYKLLLVTDEHKKEIQEKLEYVSYKKTMYEDSIISHHFKGNVGNSSFMITLNEWTFFYYFLDLLLNVYSTTGEFDEKLFNRLYKDMETFFYTEKIPIDIIAPLHNFKPYANIYDFNSLEIEDGLIIREITEDEIKTFEKNMIFNNMTFREIHTTQYVIQYRIFVPKFISGNDKSKPDEAKLAVNEAQMVLNNLITALRLQHSGAVGYSYIHCEDSLDVPVKVGQTLSRGPYKTFGKESFRLMKDDLETIPQLYKNLNNIFSMGNFPFSLSIERFNSAFSDVSPEDKIIDFAISFEILFSKQNEGTDSVSHKLALRQTRFIGEKSVRKDLYKEIKGLYTSRSNIVHGNIQKINPEENNNVVSGFEKNMRHSFKKYIEKFSTGNYKGHSDLIQEIDFE